MKNLKNILFLFLFILACPIFTFGCGELKFEDVPYSSSSLTGEEVVTNIDNARTFMITSLELRAKIETTNIYKFTATSDQEISNKTIKDVITTTIGNSKSNPAVSTVNFVRYVNNKKTYRELKTYVRKTVTAGDYVSYCYTLAETYDSEGNVVITRDRSSYDSGYYDFMRLFNNALVEAQAGEIDKIYSKNFEGTNYYKLESILDGRGVASDRFEENKNIQINPSLFTTISPEVDALTSFVYEYGISGAGYLTSAKLKYTMQNGLREKYLTVSSTSKVTSYGDKVAVLSEPEDVDDYTVETFMTNMGKEESYIVYTNSLASDYTKTTVAKFGKTNPDYAVKVETHQEGSTTTETYYYYKYDEQNENKYQCYLINKDEMTYSKSDYVLDLISFDFSLPYTSQNEGVYQYGSSGAYINVTVENKEVSKITTTKNEQEVNLFVSSFGDDTSILGLINLDNRTEVEPETEG